MAIYIQIPVPMNVPWLPHWLFDRQKKGFAASWFWLRLVIIWGVQIPADRNIDTVADAR